MPGGAKKSKYVICITLHQTHFLQVLPMRNIMPHTFNGLKKVICCGAIKYNAAISVLMHEENIL